LLNNFLPEKIRVEMLNKMRSEDGKKKYRLRKKLEKVFGHIKHNLGLRQFLTIERVKIEFDLACVQPEKDLEYSGMLRIIEIEKKKGKNK